MVIMRSNADAGVCCHGSYPVSRHDDESNHIDSAQSLFPPLNGAHGPWNTP